jgi:hypothetical protein
LLLLPLLSCLDLPDIFFLIVLQKIIWIGPVKFCNTNQHTNGASKLAQMLDLLSQSNCDLTVVGNTACKLIMQESSSVSDFNMLENGSVAWEFLKGRKLPGVMALDRVSFILFFDHFYCCNMKHFVEPGLYNQIRPIICHFCSCHIPLMVGSTV